MTTQYIPFSTARKNLSQLWKKAVQENIRYVVLVHSKPAFDICPSDCTREIPWDLKCTEEDKIAHKQAVLELERGQAISYKDRIEKLQPFSHNTTVLTSMEFDNLHALSEKSLDFWAGTHDDIFMKCDAIR